MAALLITFRQMVPGLKGMKRILEYLKDILHFNGALILLFLFRWIPGSTFSIFRLCCLVNINCMFGHLSPLRGLGLEK